MAAKKVIFFFYNRFNDPLLQSNIFQYINAPVNASDKEYQYAIITYEDKNFPLTSEETDKIKTELGKRNIIWHKLQWHEGDGFILKAIDIFNAFFLILRLRMSGYKYAVSLGSIAGSFLYIISRFIPLKYYLYQYEPHSEYAVDGNIWSKQSKQFKWLSKFETLSLKHSTVISSGTDHMRHRLEKEGINKPFFKITSVVNDTLFHFSESERAKVRKDLGLLENDKLIIYPGKMGGLYASEERMANMIHAFAKLSSTYFFLIITPQHKEFTERIDPDLRSRIKIIPTVPYEKMPAYLSAADMGIVSVLPGESQKYRSNIKVGEFLCAGLPYIICKGVSEDDVVAEKYNVGVVVNDLTEGELIKAAPLINSFLMESKIKLAERCREAGLAYRGFKIQNEQFGKAMKELTRV